jgi:uncharacterized protein (TIGR02391 family)
MLDELIREGRLLNEQIRKHYEPGVEALAPEETITVAELQGWYEGVSRVLEQQFGAESAEARLWQEGLERIRRESWEGRVSPRGGKWVIHNLSESLGLLAQIRLLQFKRQPPTVAGVSFSSLHRTIVVRCQSLFAAGEYDWAVLAGFRAVEEAIREKTGAPATELGVNLVSNAMNPKAPRLRFSDIAAEQEAYQALFRGAIGAFKNPLSHRSVGHSDPVRVFELLVLASLLLRSIDGLSEIR